MDFNYLKYLATTGTPFIHPHEKRATDLLIEELKLAPAQKVLELGCGTAGTMVRIGGRFHVTLYGLDQLDEMLKTAEKRIKLTALSKKAFLLKGKLAALPFQTNSFDRIYAESVLGILDSQTVETALDEARRVLKDQGILLLNDAIWKPTTTAEQAQTVNNACIRDFGLPLASELAWNHDDWCALFQQHGFQVTSALIEDALKTADPPLPFKNNWRDTISERFTKFQKLIHYANPTTRRLRQQYAHLLHQHHEDGRYIESRLFTLTKTQPS
ncbi:MAG: methyltransferase domain-containing protein [Candidatus Promineifilaceae bacterium]